VDVLFLRASASPSPEWPAEETGMKRLKARLERSLKDCIPAVISCMYRRGAQGQRAAELANDGVSFAYFKALEKRPRFKGDKHCFRWMVKVAVRHAIDLLRADGRDERNEEQYRADVAATGGGVFAPVSSPLAPVLEAVPDALKRLKAKERRLVQRYFFDGLTLAELSKERRTNISKVHRQIRKALCHLKQIFVDLDAAPEGWEKMVPPCRDP
jgi:RNA polymerase sigma factor (sigma-70 family)